MKKAIPAIFAFATALAISPVVLAGQSTNFTIDINDNGLLLTGTGTFSTAQSYNPSGSGATASDGYLITSFNGTITGTSAPATGAATLLAVNAAPGSSFLSPDGEFQADDLLFSGNDVVGAGTGFFDNLGLLLQVGGYEVNIFTGKTIYPGSAGSPYQLVYSNGYYTVTFTQVQNGTAPVTVPEYSGLSMLILCAITLAGGIFFKTRQPGLFLAA